jgi:hypothetical protein
VDICGHCVPRSPAAWQTWCDQVAGLTGARPFDLANLLTERPLEVAFVGLGRKLAGETRFNVYLKAKTQAHV